MATKIGTNKGETLTGTEQADTIYGRGGDDTLLGLRGRDSLFGDLGDDTLDGGIGRDFVEGGAGDDILTDRYGGDTLKGGLGDDTFNFRGNAGNTVLGGPGEDLFSSVGYHGATLTGGTDADLFKVNAAFFGIAPDEPADRITDFSRAEGDVIDLSVWEEVIDSFIGDDAFGGAGQLRYEVVGNTTVVQADFEGDGILNIELLLSGKIALNESDFVF